MKVSKSSLATRELHTLDRPIRVWCSMSGCFLARPPDLPVPFVWLTPLMDGSPPLSLCLSLSLPLCLPACLPACRV